MMFLLFNMLSRSVIAYLPRSKRLLISWLQSPSAVILEPPKIKSLIVSIVFPSLFHEVMGPEDMILVFECWVLSQLFHSLLSLSSRGSLVLRFLQKVQKWRTFCSHLYSNLNMQCLLCIYLFGCYLKIAHLCYHDHRTKLYVDNVDVLHNLNLY